MHIHTNHAGHEEQQIKRYARLIDDPDLGESATFALHLWGVDFTFCVQLPDVKEDQVSVRVSSTSGKTFILTGRVKASRENPKNEVVSFLIDTIFTQIVVIVPVPQEPDEEGLSEAELIELRAKPQADGVSVFIKPSTLPRKTKDFRSMRRTETTEGDQR